MGWDIRWHLVIGRDSFWIAPHVMTYASVVVACAISFGMLVIETWRARGTASPGTVTIAGLRGTHGFHLTWWGMAIVILAAPIARASGMPRLGARRAARTSANVKASAPRIGNVKKKTEPRWNAVWTDWSTRM